jgi:hypothetical protein
MIVGDLEYIEALAQNESSDGCDSVWDKECKDIFPGGGSVFYYYCEGGDGKSTSRPKCPSQPTEGHLKESAGECFVCAN